mmetsp:Transcript_78780/g.255244  ORF Transcript_78780/g.255244 Transcript_78780/m.255244 type:complete len:213 (+) Transcript_78780:713-1351(+)
MQGVFAPPEREVVPVEPWPRLAACLLEGGMQELRGRDLARQLLAQLLHSGAGTAARGQVDLGRRGASPGAAACQRGCGDRPRPCPRRRGARPAAAALLGLRGPRHSRRLLRGGLHRSRSPPRQRPGQRPSGGGPLAPGERHSRARPQCGQLLRRGLWSPPAHGRGRLHVLRGTWPCLRCWARGAGTERRRCDHGSCGRLLGGPRDPLAAGRP